ncbi:thiamine pyrophosphate-binding protein [Methylocapsa polymorpha]|uniref:Thiamine pyrophosphate-binding protein n=1 Tax=Methylocapsa polymorpha TaxID=3080828 RepID=A0ABZ0HW75_9HYPH|nr:thiamine pyrophosphate-binding protein [Methylocapsa sp. RX1]
MQLGTDFILHALASEDIDHLFMVPGGLVDPFLPALGRQTALAPIVAAQEGGAVYMADGYARASGKFGAALCIGGPGFTNTVTAVATAQTDGSPVLLLSGEVSTLIEGLGMFQDASPQTIDDVSIMKPIVRYSSSIDNPRNLPHLFRHALLQLRTRPSGPVHLSLPIDSQTDEISASYARIDPALVDSAPLSLAAATSALQHFLGPSCGKPPAKIAILAGAGVEHAHAARALKQFAELWQIPVATTLRAKGVFPEDHPLSLGVFGYAGTHHSRMALLDAPPDLLIVLASGLNERDTMHWSLQLKPNAAICVNLAPASIGMHSEGGGVVGDCGAFLTYLLDRSDELGPPMQATLAERSGWVSDIRSKPRLQDVENCASDAVPIHPARAISELRRVFPRDGILLVDSGAHRAFAGHYWEAYEPRTYISATNLGPMGWAIPAAIGVQCAQPQRRVAIITGDGCMHMNGIEVSTAARYKLPIVFVVINNAALGNVWLRAHKLGPVPDELTRLPDHDWAGFARALGCRGETVDEPAGLAGAFERALNGDGPCLIDVKADKTAATPVGDWASALAAYSYHE